MTRILLVDFHDSYTYNVANLCYTALGMWPDVVPFDDPQVSLHGYDAVILSPGPGSPYNAADVGVVGDLVQAYCGPVLGVCMGHQLLATLLGARVQRIQPMHGKVAHITHTGQGMWAGIPQNFAAVRYHSLAVTDYSQPDVRRRLVPDALSDDGVLMAFHATDKPWWGVQFHPESCESDYGVQIVQHWARAAGVAQYVPEEQSSVTRLPATRARAAHNPAMQNAAPQNRPRQHPLQRKPIVREIPVPDMFEAYRVISEGHAYSFWLDSALQTTEEGRYSYIGVPVVSECLVSWPDAVHRVGADGELRGSAPAGTVMDQLELHSPRDAVADVPTPFKGGWVGYLGYEARADFGFRVAHRRSNTPEAVWMRADRFLAVDHQNQQAWLVADAQDAEWIRQTEQQLAAHSPQHQSLHSTHVSQEWQTELDDDLRAKLASLPDHRRESDADYERKVRKAKEYLVSGDSYEVCLTTEAAVQCSLDSHRLSAIYARMRAANPAPYSAYIATPEATVLCTSPESFVNIRQGWVRTKPIKGTLPRGTDPVTDQRARHQLLTDPKSRAELLMVLDLLRNDLARVCEPGSVQVPEGMQVESFETVHQLLARVIGHVKPGTSIKDVVAAMFPGGSMTGAPKERTCNIIDQLEGAGRGIYSGALGWIGDNGDADLNIIIRTAVYCHEEFSVGAGGAIVLDSDPAAERQEMLLKMAAPLRWLDE